MLRIILLFSTIFLFTSLAFAQEKQTEHTLKLTPGKQSPSATIADMAWLAGHWSGEALGGDSEEIWSQPNNGAMMGMYRFIKNNKTVFYELITIIEEKGSLLIRLKHFNNNLTGWEEKNQTIDFPLISKENGAMYFDGMTFVPDGKNFVTIYLVINHKDGTIKEEVFKYKRSTSE